MPRTCLVRASRAHTRQLQPRKPDPLVIAYEMALRLVCVDAVEEALAELVKELRDE